MARSRRETEIDYDQMKKDRVRSKTGGADLLKIKEGHTLLYICPPVHAGDSLPYVEATTHFSIGPDGKRSLINLAGQGTNEPLRAALAAKDLSWEDAEAGWDKAAELVSKYGTKRQAPKNRWFFNVVVMGYRSSAHRDWEEPEPAVAILACGKSIYDGITDIIFDEGDIMNPDAAVLLVLKRTGAGLDTEYKVSTDSSSLKNPLTLTDDVWAMVEEVCKPGGQNDLYVYLASQAKTAAQVEAVWFGEDVDEVEEAPPARRGRGGKAVATRRTRKPAPEDEEVDEDEEDEEAPPAKPTKAKPTRVKVERTVLEDDEGDDEEGGGDVDDLEAELAARAAKRRK